MALTAASRPEPDVPDRGHDRALVICDVDEVVVHFLKGLEAFLAERDLWLDPGSFALNGNIRRLSDNAPLAVDDLGPLLMDFFAARTRTLEAIAGAAEALADIASSADVVMLTNLPEEFRADRIANLAGHGIPYPVVTNAGPKGPAIRSLAAGRRAPVIFIDDNHGYLLSAREHSPETHLVHFLQDPRFGRHVGHFDYVSLRTDNWSEARTHVATLIG